MAAAQHRRAPPRIGHTPIQPLGVDVLGARRTIYLKLEGENPGGSLKDRTAASLVAHAARAGAIGRDTTVVESTSGNLGVSLALVCAARGLRFRAVVDPKLEGEVVARMRALGAEIDLVARCNADGNYLQARLERVQELCRADARYCWVNQYASGANPLAHYRTTAPEIHRQMAGAVDAVFVATGTGGTLAGVGRWFREASPATRVVGVDAHGSVIFGGPAMPRRLRGIGSARPSDFITPDCYDRHIAVTDGEAFGVCRALAGTAGLALGGSSGATVAACLRYLAEHPEVRRPVCVCPDDGRNYASSIYDDRWLALHGLLPEVSASRARCDATHPAITARRLPDARA